MATVGAASLILALAVAVFGLGASLYGARAGRADWVGVGAAGRLRPRRAGHGGLRRPRAGVPALGLLVRGRRLALVDDHADLLPGRRVVVVAGGLAAAVAVAAGAVVQPRAVPRPPAPAGRRALRAGGAARPRGVLRRPARVRGVAVPDAARGADRGRGAQPAPAPPEHDDPPPDAVLGVHAVRGALRLRRRGAGRAAASTRSGSRRRAASRWLPGSSSASGSCSAPAGPTPSWAGAATGPGTRSRTRRCCRG